MVSPSSSLLLVAALLVVSLVASSSAFRAHQSPPISQQSSSSSSSPPPAPTTFPPQFYSAYSRIEAQYGQVYNSSGVIYQDQNNLRCRMTGFAGAKTPYYNLDQLAIYRPPNAQVNSAPANLLTLFNFGPYGLPSSKTPLFSCRTAETYFQSTFPFPDTWFKNGATPNVGAFWDVPYGLVFNGSTTITGRQGLRYISPATCRIARLGVIPCATFTVDATNGTPLQFSNARERRPNSYESDYFLQMTFTNFTLGAPDPSVFELPSNWVQLYRNFNNGFNVERPPGTSYSIVAPGSPLKMSIYLRTVPQAGLGVVTVNVFIKPDKNYNCTDCISWSPSSFNFDASNWRTPQTLSINYVKPGAQKLDLAASGGGYDYQMERDNSYYLSFTACEGKTGIMCNSWSMS